MYGDEKRSTDGNRVDGNEDKDEGEEHGYDDGVDDDDESGSRSWD
ncbi:hypothetical protein N9L19_00560 [bacterium]|nr:hypothetical protein [bacterium]